MSRGPGKVEKLIGELFAATRDRALSIADLCDVAFALAGRAPTRAQRLSATRAAHRLLRRVRAADAQARLFDRQAHDNTKAALGGGPAADKNYRARLEADPAWLAAEKLGAYCTRIGIWRRILGFDGRRGRFDVERDYWCATTTGNGLLYFHPPDVPVRVWAVSIQPAGVVWADAEVLKITERNVIVRYAGVQARLDRRRLWYWWAFWRGVRFVSSRTGRIAQELDKLWQERYGGAAGGAPPSMRMPLAEAIQLLGMATDYTRDDVIVAFRRAVKKAHPDLGGTAEQFRKLVEARDRLLAAIGTTAPAPKMPAYYPSGTAIRYTVARRASRQRLAKCYQLSDRKAG